MGERYLFFFSHLISFLSQILSPSLRADGGQARGQARPARGQARGQGRPGRGQGGGGGRLGRPECRNFVVVSGFSPC